MFLVLSITGLLYIFRIKLRDMFLMLVVISLFLNFTVITRDNILDHQQTEFEKVDARNYYQTISTIVKSAKLGNLIITNFNAICYEKIPREISFNYVTTDNILKDIFSDSKKQSSLYFLKLKYSDTQVKKNIQQEISNSHIKSFYDDGDYLFLEN